MSVPPSARPAPPGVLVPLYGRRLHLRSTGGGGEATVVLDGADGAGTVAWREVARELEGLARTVRYDRAGYGWSDPAPAALTADDAAQDLRAALEGAGVPGPYLLVGHGYGGAVAHHFARRYRREVVGLVLVDPRPDGFARLAPRSWRRRERARRARLALVARLARLGAAGAWLAGAAGGSATLEAPVASTAEDEPAPPPGARARAVVARLGESVPPHEGERASVPQDLGDLPLVVIGYADAERFAGLPAEDAARAQATWRRLQAELAATSRQGRLWTAEGSGDAASPRDPALVVRAVREVLAGRPPQKTPAPDPEGAGEGTRGGSRDPRRSPAARERSMRAGERSEGRL